MNLPITGERCVPGETPSRIAADHLERYRFATRYITGKSVLDIACGVGFGSALLADAGARVVTGVDISPEAIAYAHDIYQRPTITYEVGDILNYYSQGTFDVVTCFETIEHISDYHTALNNLHQLLADKGVLIISSPNRPITSPGAPTLHDQPSNRWHTQEFTVDELVAILQQHSFVVNQTDIYGQRQQRHFNNPFFRQAYHTLFNPNRTFSPEVTALKHLTPRYFLIVAQKNR